MIDIICYEQNYLKPRMYRQNARKDYLNLAKCKKRTSKKIRKAIKAQQQYMYDNKVHSVPDRIVSISQPYIRPIVSYPERVLVDQIYRNRMNRAFCTKNGIRISDPALGRPRKDDKADKKQEYIDNTDRIEVERAFSLAKRKYGLGLLTTKLDTTTRSSIALSIIAMNVSRLTVVSFAQICILVFSRYKQCFALKKYMQNKPYKLLEVC